MPLENIFESSSKFAFVVNTSIRDISITELRGSLDIRERSKAVYLQTLSAVAAHNGQSCLSEPASPLAWANAGLPAMHCPSLETGSGFTWKPPRLLVLGATLTPTQQPLRREKFVFSLVLIGLSTS